MAGAVRAAGIWSTLLGALLGALLVLDVLLLAGMVRDGLDSMACLERARSEMVLCAAPPTWQDLLLSGAAALILAMLLGIDVLRARRRVD